MFKNNTLPAGMRPCDVKKLMRSIKCADGRDNSGRRRVSVTCSTDDIEERSTVPMLPMIPRSGFSAPIMERQHDGVTGVRQRDFECAGVLSIRYWHSAAPNGFR